MASKPKFKIGQEVRAVNEDRWNKVVGITESDSFYYTVEGYGGKRIDRIAESDLVSRPKK